MTQPTDREELLAGALEAFRHLGYAATSDADIQKRINSRNGDSGFAPNTKEQLLTELVEPLLDDLDSAVTLFPRHPSWPHQGRDLIGAYLGALLKHKAIASWIDADRAVLEHPQLGTRLSEINRRMREAIRGDNRSTAARLGAAAVLGTLWRPLRNTTGVDATSDPDAMISAAMAAVASVRSS